VGRTLAADIAAGDSLVQRKRPRAAALVRAWGQPLEPGDTKAWRAWSTLVTEAETSRLVHGVPVDEVRVPESCTFASFEYRQDAAQDPARSVGLEESDPVQVVVPSPLGSLEAEDSDLLRAIGAGSASSPASPEAPVAANQRSGARRFRRLRQVGRSRAPEQGSQTSEAPTTKAPDPPAPGRPQSRIKGKNDGICL
jgi:hypothetical protein